ncbi:MAG: hypothetical protein IMX00_03485 [Limnochordales bacterium]|nr:hypothetical protein [Limnochordales bacterium]
MSQVACILLPHYYVPAVPKVAVQADQSLLRVCIKYTEVVEVSHSGQIFLDLSRLPGSSSIMPSLLKEIVLVTGLQPALGWGVNRWIAKLAARHASTRQLPALTIVPPGHEMAFLQPLPIRWADEIPEEVCLRLEQLGIRTWGQVLSVPPHHLLAQAGLEAGNLLLRLARNEDRRPLQTWPCPPWLEVSQIGEFTQEIMPVATELARSLATRLAAGDWAAGRLVLITAGREDLKPLPALKDTGPERRQPHRRKEYKAVLNPPSPVPGDFDRLNLITRQLFTRLLARLQQDDPTGEWEITLRAENLTRARQQQTRLPFAARGDERDREKRLISLLNSLQARFGPDTVRVAGEYAPDRREKVHQLLREAYELL